MRGLELLVAGISLLFTQSNRSWSLWYRCSQLADAVSSARLPGVVRRRLTQRLLLTHRFVMAVNSAIVRARILSPDPGSGHIASLAHRPGIVWVD